MPALVSCTQALGEPRYPSLKGIMAARSKEIATRSLADLGLTPARSAARVATTAVVGSRQPPARSATRVVRDAPAEAAAAGRRLPRRAEARLMGGLLVVGEVAADGTLTKVSTEVATLARSLAARRAAGRSTGSSTGPTADAAADELGATCPTVHLRSRRCRRTGPIASHRARPGGVRRRIATTTSSLPASPDGRDLAGTLSALTGWGVLANATAVRWADGGPIVEMSVFGGRLVTESAFAADHGIVTVRPNVATAEPSAEPGTIVEVSGEAAPPSCRSVRVVDRVAEASGAAPIEEARVIVAGGRGVGGPDGFRVVEELAEVLGGAVGATRAAVDAGWIPYGQQIGQTGKIVKPALYVALGISGAIQHKVGMQTADTIVAVNRDPDAPIAEFADLFVVGDLFEVVPAIVAALRARTA